VPYFTGWAAWSIARWSPIRAIGVDEIQYAKGHKYLTLVYQIDQGLTRLLWVRSVNRHHEIAASFESKHRVHSGRECDSVAFDPAAEICEPGHSAGAWVHVDGGFGLWAVAFHRSMRN